MKFISISMLFSVALLTGTAQTNPLWLRYPSISPDGSTIVFTYKGDLYQVPATGGTATPLTLHEAHDFNAVWSPDGSRLAFASDRYGNFDVFVISRYGGEPQRLTYHSSREIPYAFSADGKQVYFSAQRSDDKDNRQYPSAGIGEVYSVPVQGGMVSQLLTTPAEDMQWTADGKKMFYTYMPGRENPWRKHHTSSVARDIAVYTPAGNTHTILTSFKGEDRDPVLADGGNTIYYLSEAAGSFNVYRMAANGSNAQAVTDFKTHPVRFLSGSNSGTLCFSYNGELYTHQGGKTTKVPVSLYADLRGNAEKTIAIGSGISEMRLSPNGKELAFIFRGDVFAANADGSGTRQLTQTPEPEGSISWMPDGRSLVYTSERGGRYGIYQLEMVRTPEPYFYAGTLRREKELLKATGSLTNPELSPDGKELAYTEGFNTLKVLTIADGKSRTLVEAGDWLSWGDGGHEIKWSPDGKWLLTSFSERSIGNSEIGLISASGKKLEGKNRIINVSNNGFGDFNPQWMMGGKMIMWFSNRDGLSSKANSGNSQLDAYGLFLTREAWDNYNLGKDDAALAKELREKAAKADSTKKAAGKKDSVLIEWSGLDIRKARLTIHSSILSDALVDKDGENLYYLSRFEKGANLWTTNLRTRETKILAPLNSNRAGSMSWDKDGKKIFLQSDAGIVKVDAATGKVDRVSTGGEMQLDAAAERMNMFEHVVRRTSDIFYKQDFHGIAWQALAADCRRQVPHTGNAYEFSELLSEMLGELNVSHSGSSYSPRPEFADATGALGIFFDQDFKGPGLRITEVVAGGPLDKAGFDIKPGAVIEMIDGEMLDGRKDAAAYLNRKVGNNVLLSLAEEGRKRDLVVKPISTGEEDQLLYRRWVRRNAEEVDRLSNGQLGYIHIPGMNDGAYRTALEDAMGKYAGRKGLVVDTRSNNGGDLVADLAMWLSGKRFMEYSNDREVANYEPTFRWNKPSISLADENNYSDGHCYAFAYKYLKLGKLVGMPVPGTCTFAGWEILQDGQTRWGTPPMGVRMMDGRYLENSQTEPDIKVVNEYSLVSKGKDPQLEAAVAELMKEIR